MSTAILEPAVDRTLPPARPRVQASLKVGAVDDPLEREADAIAERVMRMPDPASALLSRASSTRVRYVQRCPGGCPPEGCEDDVAHRQPTSGGAAVGVSTATAAAVRARRGTGRQLGAPERAFFEPRLGVGLGGVRVHTDAGAAVLSRRLGARAFTVGHDVFFGTGEYAPATVNGRRLLAHELVHTLQQRPTGPPTAEPRSQWTPANGGDGLHDERGLTTQRTPARGGAHDECPGHDPGEVARSRTDEGILTEPVSMRAPQLLLVADFGVGRSAVKQRVQRDSVLRGWLASFEENDSYRLRLLGLDDCVGKRSVREQLRQARAESVRDLLRPDARRRVEFAGAAPLDDYTMSNASSGGRAMNRSVLINFRQEVDGEPIPVEGRRTTVWSVPRTRGCGKGTNATHPASEVREAHRRASEMLWYAVTASAEWEDAHVQRLARRHFKVTPHPTLELWGRITTALSSMLAAVDEASYECERKQRGWRGCLAGTLAIALHHIRLCPRWWNRGTDRRAEVLLHEWAHKWGRGVARILETYCSDPGFRNLPSTKLVESPDAYSSYIFELATGDPPAC